MRRAFAKGIWAGAAILASAGFAGRSAAEDAAKPSEKPAKPAESMTAEQVLDKALEASGGKAAWEKVKTMEMKITMDVVNQGLKITATEVSKAPNLHYTQTQVAGMKIEQGFDGKKGWAKDPMMGLRDVTGAELDQMRRSALEANYNWKPYFTKAEYKGIEKVGDADAHKVELTPKEGNPVTRWYDAKTFLLLQQTETQESPQGEVEGTIKFQEYRDEGGLKIPNKIIVETLMGNMNGKLESIKINGAVDDAKFQKPADKDEEGDEAEEGQETPAPKQQRTPKAPGKAKEAR